MRTISCILLGYLLGGVLFAPLSLKLCGKLDALADSPDGNPGAYNAFRLGGFWCGCATVLGDLLKGIVPVYCYVRMGGNFSDQPFLSALALAAPVLGHIYPLRAHFHGGKGVCTTFGCLLGLLPVWQPVILFAALFLLFTLVLVVTPDFYKTLLVYLAFPACLALLQPEPGLFWGSCVILLGVLGRFLTSPEEKAEMKMRFLWKS